MGKNGTHHYRIDLETERLFLRNLLPEDVESLVDLWTDPVITKYMGGPRDRTELTATLQEDCLQPYAYEFDLWPVIEKATGKLIGHCGLLDKDIDQSKQIEVIYVIARDHWGKGFASEAASALMEHAFSEKDLRRVVALIHPGNERSEKVSLSCGMSFEKEIEREGGKMMRLFARDNTKRGCRTAASPVI